MSKLDIASEMRAYDNKARNYLTSMTEEEAKKFSPYILMRWGASVEGDADMQEWYLRATNERVNVNFFDVNSTRHKQLLWLTCTTASPGMGTHRHYWLAPKKKESSSGPVIKLIRHLYPHLKSDEVDLMARLNDLKAVKEMARMHGLDDKQIKEYSK